MLSTRTFLPTTIAARSIEARHNMRCGFSRALGGQLLNAVALSRHQSSFPVWRIVASLPQDNQRPPSLVDSHKWIRSSEKRGAWHSSVHCRVISSDAGKQAEAAIDEALLIGERKVQRRVINLPDPELHDGEAKRVKKKRKVNKSYLRYRKRPKPLRTFPSGLPDEDFLVKVRELKVFKKLFYDLNVPKTLWDNQELGLWVADQKHRYTMRWMTIEERDLLDKLGFVWHKTVDNAEWHLMLHELRRFKAVFNNLNVPERWRSDDWPAAFPRWFHQQPALFEQRRLSPDKVMKLRTLVGLDLKAVTGDTVSDEQYSDQYERQMQLYGTKPRTDFEIMYSQLREWMETYYTCHVPRRVHDNVVLGEWVHRTRRKYKRKIIEQWVVERLNELDFEWKVHQLDARWYSLYHHLRRYKEVHGTCVIPDDYSNVREPNWVEASRWIERQHKLYFKQKLSPHKVKLLKDLGVNLDKPYGPLGINPMVQETDPVMYAKLREKHEEMLRKRRKVEKRAAKRRKLEKAKEMERKELLNWYLPFGDPRFR